MFQMRRCLERELDGVSMIRNNDERMSEFNFSEDASNI